MSAATPARPPTGGRTGRKTAIPTPPAPRWAVVCAWIIPFTILPSAVWRASLVFMDDDPWRLLVAAQGWYLVLLSVLSLALGLLSVGLVRPWGERWPRWVPGLGGRAVPARPVVAAARTGAVLLALAPVYLVAYAVFEPYEVTPLIEPGDRHLPTPGPAILSLYVPMALWGPLLWALATDYGRRRAGRVSGRTAAAVTG